VILSHPPRYLFVASGLLLLIPYGIAWRLGDLRAQTTGFLYTIGLAFALYAVVSVMALRTAWSGPHFRLMAFALAIFMHGVLVLTPPTLSDDMYRYVWEGRLQGHGISPYAYPPDAPAVAHLRDEPIWPLVNRKSAITVYPPAAEAAYALLWRLWPDSVRWFQIAMAGGGLLAGALLVGLLQALRLPETRLLIYLWSPLLVFETAHGAHVDGLVLPVLVGAWWARVRERDWLVGVLLGLATALKLYPALLLPALWRPNHRRGRWQLPLAFGITVAACYAPYVVWSGIGVLGFLPKYFNERFNLGLAGLLIPLFTRLNIDPSRGILILTLLGLASAAVWLVVRPAADGAMALRRCIWLIGIFTLLTQNLFAWYLLWTLPLIALFLQPGPVAGLGPDGWTGWWLFSGLVMLSYSFFMSWRPVPFLLGVQFIPLYLLLLLDGMRRVTSMALTTKRLTPPSTPPQFREGSDPG
jgi:alpha-1,6-mannosyltransferase